MVLEQALSDEKELPCQHGGEREGIEERREPVRFLSQGKASLGGRKQRRPVCLVYRDLCQICLLNGSPFFFGLPLWGKKLSFQ